MKKQNLILALALLSLAALYLLRSHAAEQTSFQVAEFVTIRWDGREHSYWVRPSGKIEKLRQLFERFPRPDGIDERVYYLGIAMNAVAKEGYDFAGMTQEQIVMRRQVVR